MTVAWDDDGIELMVKTFAGLALYPGFGVGINMTYTDADFSWPDYLDDWDSRTGNAVTVSRIPLCTTEGTVTGIQGGLGQHISNSWVKIDNILTKSGIDNAVAVGETAKPKMTITFTR